MSLPTSTSDPVSAAFAALADPTRRAILARLAQGDTRVGELIKPFAVSGPAISRHLRVLEGARLIERQVDAQWRICRLNPPGLRVASDWLAQYRHFWEGSLDRLVEVLEQDAGAPTQPEPPAPPVSRRTPRGRRTDGAKPPSTHRSQRKRP